MAHPLELAAAYVDEEKGVATAEAALCGAQDIIAEQISDDAGVRKRLRVVAKANAKLISKAAEEDAGDDVLAAVLLHPGEAQRKVDGAFHRCTHFQRAVAKVYHSFSPFPGVDDGHAPQPAGVRCLSAAFRIKSRGIQGDLPAFFDFCATGDGGGKFR